MSKHYIIILICTFLGLSTSYAQEFTAQVKVSTPQLQLTDPSVFEDLEGQVTEFMNNQSFTGIDYEPEEKININFQIVIKQELGNNTFTGEIAILATRPVYGSSYETTTFTYLDKDVKFQYALGQPIQYAPNSFIDNLSSILSFYAFYMLGYDYDSFKELGGELYFERAQDVVNNVPAGIAGDVKGWQAGDSDRNRYWLVENALNPRGQRLRKAMYTYHRKGLDVMFSNVADGQRQIMAALQEANSVHQDFPNSMIVPSFVSAKSSEVIEIMSKANRNMRRQVYALMVKMDAAGATKYQSLR